MNRHSAWWDFDPATDRRAYVRQVTGAYAATPTCAGRVRREDRRLAHRLFDRRIPLRLVRAALSLAAMRRLYRPPGAAPLSPVRSLHYFLPLIDEIRQADIDPEYFFYVEHKVRSADGELARARPISTHSS